MMRPLKSDWHATKARLVLAALVRIGWRIKRQRGSHRTLQRSGWPDYLFADHDGVEIGRVRLAKLGKKTGLRPEDL